MNFGKLNFIASLLSLVSLCLVLAAPPAIAKEGKRPIAVIVEGETYMIGEMSKGGLSKLQQIMSSLGVTQGGPRSAEDETWCEGDLCYCVGSERECLEMLALVCKRPPGSVCGDLPTAGGYGCSCLRMPGRGEPRDRFEVEFLYR